MASSLKEPAGVQEKWQQKIFDAYIHIHIVRTMIHSALKYWVTKSLQTAFGFETLQTKVGRTLLAYMGSCVAVVCILNIQNAGWLVCLIANITRNKTDYENPWLLFQYMLDLLLSNQCKTMNCDAWWEKIAIKHIHNFWRSYKSVRIIMLLPLDFIY